MIKTIARMTTEMIDVAKRASRPHLFLLQQAGTDEPMTASMFETNKQNNHPQPQIVVSFVMQHK